MRNEDLVDVTGKRFAYVREHTDSYEVLDVSGFDDTDDLLQYAEYYLFDKEYWDTLVDKKIEYVGKIEEPTDIPIDINPVQSFSMLITNTTLSTRKYNRNTIWGSFSSQNRHLNCVLYQFANTDLGCTAFINDLPTVTYKNKEYKIEGIQVGIQICDTIEYKYVVWFKLLNY